MKSLSFLIVKALANKRPIISYVSSTNTTNTEATMPIDLALLVVPTLLVLNVSLCITGITYTVLTSRARRRVQIGDLSRRERQYR
jgi:hypothetical protein